VAARLTTSWQAPTAGPAGVDTAREADAVAALGARLTGSITWSSNRSGNHELYLLDLPSGKVQQLTDHPNVDFGARFSPDGSQLVFMRSRREWVSFREVNAWNVVLLNLETGREKVLARRAYKPTWGPDGDSVVFLRGQEILQLDLTSGDEEVIFDGAQVIEGRTFGDPELHPGGSLLALSIKNYGAIVISPGATDYVRLTDRQVCQTTWVPGTDELLWMESSGNGGTQVMRGAADGSGSASFMDLPGPRSHEYFPRLSRDGTWMVWAAAAEGHEHDRADYEIYAWEVGTPPGDAIRLTYFTGNDQWPDIRLGSADD
jgi:Tol biopolymer transport system component